MFKNWFGKKDNILDAKSAYKNSKRAHYKIIKDATIHEINRAINGGYFACKVDLLNGDKNALNDLITELIQLGYHVENNPSKYPAYIILIISWDSLSLNPLKRAMDGC